MISKMKVIDEENYDEINEKDNGKSQNQLKVFAIILIGTLTQ